MFLRHRSRKLAAYFDGGLTQQEVRQTELHLRECADCRDECERDQSWEWRASSSLPIGRGARYNMVLHRDCVSGKPVPPEAGGSLVALGFRGEPAVGRLEAVPIGGWCIDRRRDGTWCGSMVRRRWVRNPYAKPLGLEPVNGSKRMRNLAPR